MPPRRRPVRSSSVAAVGYDEALAELHVEYASGEVYVYAMVPRSVYRRLLQADSVGAFVNQEVKPVYPGRHLPS